jgi:hypothetical protein
MKFNKSFFNWSLWITLLSTYVLPYQSTDGFVAKYGYPFPFFTIHNTNRIGLTLLMSNTIDVVLLAIDIFIVYLVIYFIYAILIKRKSVHDKNDINNF